MTRTSIVPGLGDFQQHPYVSSSYYSQNQIALQFRSLFFKAKKDKIYMYYENIEAVFIYFPP
jgi:hypothetical protein